MKKFAKLLLLFVILVTTSALFLSCQKDVFKNGDNQEITVKVNSWLDSKKPTAIAVQSANIDLLKDNLDFSNMRTEQSGQSEKLIIIPIKEALKTAKKIENSFIPNLVLTLDKSGNIRKGNIVLYQPGPGQVDSRIPENTFYNIKNTGKLDCDGKFRFLTVTGRWLYELGYKNGKINSFGEHVSKIKSGSNSVSRTNVFCVDWYIISTWYDEWGGIINQQEDYAGTTCQSEYCYDPYAETECPVDYTSGGGGGDDQVYEYAVVRPFSWEVAVSTNYYWRVMSTEEATGVKVQGEFQGGHFTSITHQTSFEQLGSTVYTWEQLSNTVSVDNPWLVYAYTQGKIHIVGGTYAHHQNSTLRSFGDMGW